MIADAHPVFLEGLARVIRERPDMDLVGQAEDGPEAVALAQELQPDVALIDERIPGLSGTGVLDALRWRGIPVRVVLLAAFAGGETVHAAIAGGARGFLSKEAGRQEICEAVSRVARGEMLVDARVENALLDAIQRHAARESKPVISEREIQVLRLLSHGASTTQIAADLHVSPETVRSHLKAIFAKLDVSTRTAAVAEAMRRGLMR